MTHRFEAGLVLVFVGVVLLTVVWALRKRDDAMYVEPDVDDGDDLDEELRALVDDERRAS